MSSFTQQYHINLFEEQGRKLPKNIFINYCYMLNEETALGKIIQIRSCEDKDILKNFTDEQNEIRDKWRKRFRKNNETRLEINLHNLDLIFEHLSQ